MYVCMYVYIYIYIYIYIYTYHGTDYASARTLHVVRSRARRGGYFAMWVSLVFVMIYLVQGGLQVIDGKLSPAYVSRLVEMGCSGSRV